MDETHRAMTEHDLALGHGEGSDLHYGKVTLVAVECVAQSKRVGEGPAGPLLQKGWGHFWP